MKRKKKKTETFIQSKYNTIYHNFHIVIKQADAMRQRSVKSVRIPGLTRETRKRSFPKRITSEQGLLAKQGGGKPPHTLGLICTRV